MFCSLRETLENSPSSAKIVGAGFRLEWLVQVAAHTRVCVCGVCACACVCVCVSRSAPSCLRARSTPAVARSPRSTLSECQSCRCCSYFVCVVCMYMYMCKMHSYLPPPLPSHFPFIHSSPPPLPPPPSLPPSPPPHPSPLSLPPSPAAFPLPPRATTV